MKTHISDNLLLFRKHFNHLYHQLRNSERDKEKYCIVGSRSGQPTLQVMRNNEKYYLHSNYDPSREATKWAEQLSDEVKKAKQVVFYGIGLGYHLEAFLEKYPNKQIYLIEPDTEVLLAAIEARNLGKILNNKNIAVFGFGSKFFTVDKFVQAFIEQVSQEHAFVFPPSYQRAYREEINAFQVEVQTAVLRYRGNMHTILRFREEWPENIFQNMTKNIVSKPIGQLKDVAKNIPVVIVGSGPSLDLDKQYLQQVAERALIFAAGTSIQALLSMDIVPDMIFSIDGSEKNYEAFKKLDYDEIPLVYCPFVNHKIIRNKNKHLFHVVMKNDKISQYLLDANHLREKFYSTTSVTGIALQAAAYLGCNPIFLMGQDLSFPDKKFYAGNVNHFTDEELEKEQKKAVLTVENVQGGLNDTSKPMLNMLRDMELCIEAFTASNDVINTSKIGAKIKGTKHRLIEDVLDTLLTQKLDKSYYYGVIEQASAQVSEKEQITEIYNKMKQVYTDLGVLKEDATAILEELDNLRRVKPHLMQKKIEEIDQQWLSLVNRKVFEYVVGMCIETQIGTYKRYLPIITQETDMKEKVDLIYKHMGMVLVATVKTIPGLKSKLEIAMKQYYKDHLEGERIE